MKCSNLMVRLDDNAAQARVKGQSLRLSILDWVIRVTGSEESVINKGD